MSDMTRRVFGGILCAGIAMAVASNAGAQSTADYRTRLAALATAWKGVHSERALTDSLQLRAVPPDTLRSGALVLLTTPRDSAFGRVTIEAAAAELTRVFGPPADHLKTRPFVLTRHGGALGDSIAETAEVGPAGTRLAVSSTFATRATVTEVWKHRGARYLAEDAGPEFARWLRIGLPIDSATADTWVDVRIDLVTSPAESAHHCFTGDFPACALALGLTGDDDPAMRWYQSGERRSLVVNHYYYEWRQARSGQFSRCNNLSDEGACDSLARLIPPEAISPRLGADARQSVTRVALAIGGRGAFARMLAAPRRVEDQLRAASGVSTDSLMRAWHAQVLAVSPGTTTMNVFTATTAIFWAALCGGLALRSSRWR
jgi:hypothetical protein